ncbi:lipoprotein [Streptomyces venetus]|uniref:Lipoprotein n=1 Tax=Streptomyces venetus TaxID=1701086 RepID=A0ABP8FEX1_9ACTN
MRTRTTTAAAAALTAAVALLLTGCGGSDDASNSGDGDKIAGADSGSGSSKPSASASADNIDRPEIKLPSDVENVFEGGSTGDPVKDAVLADNERMINSIDEAITVDGGKHPALKFYSKDDALLAAATYVQSFADAGTTWTGQTRYYDREVTLDGKTSATVTYCGDETKSFSKDRKTKEVKRTPGDADDYVSYNARMEKNAKGVWQAAKVTSQRGAEQCRP